MIVYWCAVAGLIILIVGVTTSASKFVYNLGYDIFHSVPPEEDSTRKMVVTVPEDCTIQVMGSALKKQGLIENELAFYIQSILYGYELVPGEHVISPAMTSVEILKTLCTPEVETKD